MTTLGIGRQWYERKGAGSGERNVVVMTDVRHDLVSGRVVDRGRGSVVAPAHARASRSRTRIAAPSTARSAPATSPMTPPEIARTGPGAPGEPGWRVRVFPNLYPITDAHEVVVLSPDHDRTFGDLSDDAAAEVFTVLRDRVRAHLDAGLPFATAIVNQGRAAGASIAHPHAQVFGLDFVPPEVNAAIDRQLAAPDDLLDDDIAHARTTTTSCCADGEVTVWCPFASTSSLLVRVCHAEAGTTFRRRDRRRGRRHRDRDTRRARRRRPGDHESAVQPGRAHGTALVRRESPHVSACSRDSNRRPACS